MVRIIIPLVIAATFSSCYRDRNKVPQPQRPDEVELISTMRLVFNTAATGDVTEAVFRDPDGDGGAPPAEFDTIRLTSNTQYTMTIMLLDETKVPPDTVSDEVREKAEEHQFFFDVSGAEITFSYRDTDAHGVPVGLSAGIVSGAATKDKNGKIKVVLKHQGDAKPDSGNGDPGVGETDIEVNFPVIIQ